MQAGSSVVYRPLSAEYVESLQYILVQLALVFVFYGEHLLLRVSLIGQQYIVQVLRRPSQ